MINLEHLTTLTYNELSGTISAEEKQQLQAYLTSSEEARMLYVHIVESHKGFSDAELIPTTERVDAILRSEKRKNSIVRLRRVSVAAALAAGIMGGVWYWNNTKSNVGTPKELSITHNEVNPLEKNQSVLTTATGQRAVLTGDSGTVMVGANGLVLAGLALQSGANSAGPSWASIAVPNGKTYKLMLPDGTRLWMNAGSKVKFLIDYEIAARSLEVEGEVFLDVAPDKDRPFSIQLKRARIEVLGTTLNINTSQQGQEEVALLSGAVRMVGPTGKHMLRPGLQGVLRQDGKITLSSFDKDQVLAWQRGEVIFDDQPIGVLVQKMEQTFGVTISLDAPENDFSTFSGTIKKEQGLEYFLEKLRDASMIRSYQFDNLKTLHIK